ncbi:glutathione S-transferase family protein [Marinicella sediminis]|uniref:Glutathione S-transferase family protein n=1 Tax=Marinicella sediminis TaxID=1792834 RepID=A0ABV7J8L2_9GAMM|nr:glutathione S-transferase family protein [Marinicella sediminis]
MITLYTYNTINGQVAELVLHCLEQPHQIKTVDLMKGEQRSAEFLKMNPSGRIPVLVDPAERDGRDKPLVVSQTGAIVTYLGRQYGDAWYPQNESSRSQVDEWIWFQLTDISTNLFNNFYLKSLIEVPQPEAANVLRDRALDFYQVFDQALKVRAYLTGSDMTLADLVSFPVVHASAKYGLTDRYAGLKRWYRDMQADLKIRSWLDRLR